MAQVVMLRTGPLGFLLGSFVCLRGGQLVFPALATEGEHLARYRGDDCKVSCLGSGLGFRWDHWAKVGVGTKGFVREGRASPGCAGGSKEGSALPQWGAPTLVLAGDGRLRAMTPKPCFPQRNPLSRARLKGDRRG